MEDELLKNGERFAKLLIDDLKLIQNSDYFSFSLDAVLLANFCNPGNNSRVIELGTATGVIPHLVWSKNKIKEIVGIDLQSDLINMAKRSAQYNRLANNLKFKELDLRQAVDFFGAESFDYLISNPPYLKQGSGKMSENKIRAIARYELECTLEEVIKVSVSLLKYKAKACYVYRTQRLAELLSLMEVNNLTPKRMRLIYPNAKSAAKLFLVEGQKGANTGLEVLAPLILHNKAGDYTEEMSEIFYPEAD